MGMIEAWRCGVIMTGSNAMSGKGSGIFKSKNETATYSYEGLCEEIDESVFEKALKETES